MQQNKLTAEETIIAAKWQKESDERSKIFDQLQSALDNNEFDLFDKLTKSVFDSKESHCEHNVSCLNECKYCDELERKLNAM